MTDPTPPLCCTHGDRIDRILRLVEEVHAVRVGKLATGGVVKPGPDDRPTGDVGGIIQPPEGHVPEPIVIDLRHEQVITAEQRRSDSRSRAVLDELNRERGADEPMQVTQAVLDDLEGEGGEQ